jgi:hypothetical protein
VVVGVEVEKGREMGGMIGERVLYKGGIISSVWFLLGYTVIGIES